MTAIDFDEYSEEMLSADGFDAAVIGVAYRCASQPILAYDYDKCVEVLMERDEMSRIDAIEYMDFNVVDAYVGNGTPCFIRHGSMNDTNDE